MNEDLKSMIQDGTLASMLSRGFKFILTLAKTQELQDALELAQLQRDMLRDALAHYVGDTEPYAPKCVRLDVDIVDSHHDTWCVCGHIGGCHAPSVSGDRDFCDGCPCEHFEAAPPGWTWNEDHWIHDNGCCVTVQPGVGIFATDDVGANVVGPHEDVLQAMHRAVRQSEEDEPALAKLEELTAGPWIWSDKEENDLASMGRDMVVHIKAGTLRDLINWSMSPIPEPEQRAAAVSTVTESLRTLATQYTETLEEIVFVNGFRGLDCEKHGFHPHQRVKGTGTYLCCACVKEK